MFADKTNIVTSTDMIYSQHLILRNMTYKPNSQQVTFVLPIYFTKAEIIFTKSARSLDHISFRVAPNSKAMHAVSTEILEKGQWLAQLIWSEGRSQFCSEKVIEIC
jgi:hypothetical protein